MHLNHLRILRRRKHKKQEVMREKGAMNLRTMISSQTQESDTLEDNAEYQELGQVTGPPSHYERSITIYVTMLQ